MFEFSSVAINPTVEIDVDILNQMMLNDIANEEMRKLSLEAPLAYASMDNNRGTPSATPGPNTTSNALYFASQVTTGVELNVDNVINSPLSIEVSVDRGGIYRFYVIALLASGAGNCIPTFQITDIDTNVVQEIGGYITSGTQSSTTGNIYTPSILFTDRWLYGGKTYRFTVTTGLLATSSDIGYIDAYAYPPKIAYFWVQGYNGTGQQIEIPSFQVPLFSIDIPDIELPDFEFPDITFPDFDFPGIGIIDPDLEGDFGNFEPNIDTGDLTDDGTNMEWLYIKPASGSGAPGSYVTYKSGLPVLGSLSIGGRTAEATGLWSGTITVENGLTTWAGGSWCHPRAYVVPLSNSTVFAEATVTFPTLTTSSPLYNSAGYYILISIGYSFGGQFRSISTSGGYAEAHIYCNANGPMDNGFNLTSGGPPERNQRVGLHFKGNANVGYGYANTIEISSGNTLRYEYDYATHTSRVKVNGVTKYSVTLTPVGGSGYFDQAGSVPTLMVSRQGAIQGPPYHVAGYDPGDVVVSNFSFGFV